MGRRYKRLKLGTDHELAGSLKIYEETLYEDDDDDCGLAGVDPLSERPWLRQH